MQPKYLHNVNGKEITESDVNTWSTAASAADDIVFAQLFRMAPFLFGVSKGIVPSKPGYTVLSTGTTDRSIIVWPFRAFVGSTTFASVDPRENWDGIRSQIYVNSTAPVETTVALDSNSSGNPRWDLLYAKVNKDLTIDDNVRYVKSITGTVISEGPTTIINVVNTTVEIGVVKGTPANPPVVPSLPADVSGTTYYIAVAAIRVSNGSTQIANTDIYDMCPNVLSLSEVTGACSSRPSSAMYDLTGSVMSKSTLGAGDWGFTGSRPNVFLPASFTGEESRWFLLDVQDAAATSNWSQVSDSIVDSTIDWRNRFFVWQAQLGTGTKFASEQGATFADGFIPRADFQAWNLTDATFGMGMGQSFTNIIEESTPNKGFVAIINNQNFNNPGVIQGGTDIRLYVDYTNGNLKVKMAGFPQTKMVMKITASPQFANNQ